jgi:hypothetical protein
MANTLRGLSVPAQAEALMRGLGGDAQATICTSGTLVPLRYTI